MKRIYTALYEWLTRSSWVGIDRKMIDSWALARDIYNKRGRL